MMVTLQLTNPQTTVQRKSMRVPRELHGVREAMWAGMRMTCQTQRRRTTRMRTQVNHMPMSLLDG